MELLQLVRGQFLHMFLFCMDEYISCIDIQYIYLHVGLHRKLNQLDPDIFDWGIGGKGK